MKDIKLEQRKETFQKNNTNILEVRQGFKLSLRKERIDDYIMQRRQKTLEKMEDRCKLEINPETLILPSEILNKDLTKLDDFMEFVTMLLNSKDLNYVKFGVLHIRKQLTLEMNPPILELTKAGIIPMLLNVLDQHITHDSIVYEILWCFTNLTAGDVGSDVINSFLTPKAFRIFERIMKSNKLELIYHMIWLITHIGTDNENSRNIILNSNIFNMILEMLEKETINVFIVKHGMWLISSMSKNWTDIDNFQLFERILKIICTFIRYNDPDIIGDAIWALCNYSNTQYSHALRIILDMGVLPIIFRFKDTSANLSLLEAPLRIVGNLMTGDDQMLDEALKLGVIEYLELFLNSQYGTLRREATWSLANIGAGTKNQIQTLIQSGVLPKIYELVKDPSKEVAREAIWVCSNCLTGSDLDMTINLAKSGIMMPILYVIVHYLDPNLLGIALEGLKQMFLQGEVIKQIGNGRNPFVDHFIAEGGTEHLERLQNHANNEIYSQVISILDNYFESEEIQRKHQF